jgi:hypothetical protein
VVVADVVLPEAWLVEAAAEVERMRHDSSTENAACLIETIQRSVVRTEKKMRNKESLPLTLNQRARRQKPAEHF